MLIFQDTCYFLLKRAISTTRKQNLAKIDISNSISNTIVQFMSKTLTNHLQYFAETKSKRYSHEFLKKKTFTKHRNITSFNNSLKEHTNFTSISLEYI